MRVRLKLTVTGLVWLASGLAALAASLVLLGGVGEDVVNRNGVYRSDPARLSWFVGHRDVLDVDAARLLAVVGSVAVLLALAVAATVVLIGRRVQLALAVTPIVALLAAGATAAMVKALVHRARPPATLQLAAETSANSFPSGHSTDAAAFSLALALVIAIVVLRRPVARVACVLAAAFMSIAVAASRLILGVHWPSDVVAGLALGTTVAIATVMAAVVTTRLASTQRLRQPAAALRLAIWSRPTS